MTPRALAVLSLLAGCGAPPADVAAPPTPVAPPADGPLGPSPIDLGHPTGSSALAPTPDGVLLADPDSDSLVHRTHVGGGGSFLVGNEPTRVAPLGDGYLVTLRADGNVARVDVGGAVTRVAPVGLEPFGVVTRSDGLRAYVAASLDGQVHELDGDTLEILRTFDVPGEPRWLALSPDATTLWVASTTGMAPLHRIALATGERTSHPLPATSRDTGGSSRIALRARVTGDLEWSPSLDALVVPVLYADTTTPIVQVGVEPQDPDGSDGEQPLGEMYGSGAGTILGIDPSVGKLTPAVVLMPAAGAPRALYAGATFERADGPDGQEDDPSDSGLPSGSVVELRTYLSGVVTTPAGLIVAPMEASDAVVVLDPDVPVEPTGLGALLMEGDNAPDQAGMELVATAGVRVRARPSSLALTDRGVVAGSVLGRTIQRVGLQAVSVQLQINGGQGINAQSTLTSTELLGDPLDPVLPPDVSRGRMLFHDAVVPEVSAGGVSCSTCHVDGRNDGFTWTFANGPRSTPSLAGRVSDTVPVTWTQGVGSVAEEARTTIEHRMGGLGLSPADEQAIAAFVDWTRAVKRPAPTEASERGRLLFERADVGCTACHSGARGTDGLPHLLRGVALDTPGLDGVGATGPWLHDGSAATLREVLDPAKNGGMGSTLHLTDAELDDLVAYLQTR